ncbi:hypothetical protein [Xenorhabdus sp. SGI246]|uniref:hypothetical protein n=1 Tax=Xenorhabdus sp. SGI246 TaxID=3158263 RepID=UPI00349F1162
MKIINFLFGIVLSLFILTSQSVLAAETYHVSMENISRTPGSLLVVGRNDSKCITQRGPGVVYLGLHPAVSFDITDQNGILEGCFQTDKFIEWSIDNGNNMPPRPPECKVKFEVYPSDGGWIWTIETSFCPSGSIQEATCGGEDCLDKPVILHRENLNIKMKFDGDKFVR